MKKYNIVYLISLIGMSITAQITYPKTEKQITEKEYFGTKVQENYQWLEDDLSPETQQWVQAENNFTENYLSQIPNRDKIRKGLTQLLNYKKTSMPFQVAGTLYYFKNDGLQMHDVLYFQNEKGEEELLLDPNTFSEDGSVSLSSFDFSKDGSLVAYQVSEGGADWKTVYIMDVKSKTLLPDVIQNVKFSNIAWQNNNRFFYSTYSTPQGSQLSAKTLDHRLLLHTLGTSQNDDQVVFGNEEDPRRYVWGSISEDQNYLIVTAANSTYGNELIIFDLNEPEFKPRVIQDDFEAETHYFSNEDRMFYFVTNRNAPNNKMVKLDLDTYKTPENWYDFLPEAKHVMEPTTVGDKIFVTYRVDANNEVVVYTKDGRLLYQIELPGKGSVAGFRGSEKDTFTFFQFENYITPSTTFQYNIANNTFQEYSRSKVQFKPEDYLTEQHFYTSKDGTQVPITISYKKGTELNGTAPTILYGYGGFNISLQPQFSAVMAYWLSQGGIYAVANLRGGGEYGQSWHEAGTQLQKKNVFEDFIAAAEFLTNNQYTSTKKLAIRGGSNGGLLVGATMTMKPDIAAVALPAVGVLDMLKYHTFTSGAGWAYDYGTAEDSQEMFEYLYSYSPVHNVKKGICYPATMITTGDHDDRVVPAHSFKFAAELQDKQACQNPILIRIETNAGHGAGKSMQTIIEEYTDVFSFTLYHMSKK